jgi:D-amino-acid dehydrogenase
MSASTRVVIVGGGIVAASVAYHLARRGVSVIVIEGEQAGAATDAGAGIICPWTAPAEDARYRLSAEGARYYPELLAMLADDGENETGYARVGTLCVAEDTQDLSETAARLRSRLAGRPEIGDVAMLEPGGPAEMFPPLAAGLAGVWIAGGARVDGRAIRDSLLRGAASRGARRMRGTAVLDWTPCRATGQTIDRATDWTANPETDRTTDLGTGEATDRGAGGGKGRVMGVRVGAELIGADVVVVAAGAWTAQVCGGLAWPLPIGPQRGQIVHARLPGADTAAWPVVLAPDDPYLLGFPDGRVVLGATREDAGFEYETTIGGVGGLLAAAVELAPGLSAARLLETRIGFRPVTPDGRPVIGQVADGLFVAAGHGPEGLTAGPWTGLAAAALALGEPPAADLTAFDPARFHTGRA